MLNSAKAHTLLFSGTQISTPLAERTPRQYRPSALLNVCLSFPLPPAALHTDNHMSTSDDAGFSGRLRSATRPNPEAQETGGERLTSRPDSHGGLHDSRRRRPPDEVSGGDNKDNKRGHRQGTPADRVDSIAHKEEPGSSSTRLGGVSAPAVASPGGTPPAGLPELDRAPPPPPGLSALNRAPPQSSRDRSIQADTHSTLASKVTRAQRALHDAHAIVVQREARQHRHDEDVEQAKAVTREASLLLDRARRASAAAVGPEHPSRHPLGLSF